MTASLKMTQCFCMKVFSGSKLKFIWGGGDNTWSESVEPSAGQTLSSTFIDIRLINYTYRQIHLNKNILYILYFIIN